MKGKRRAATRHPDAAGSCKRRVRTIALTTAAACLMSGAPAAAAPYDIVNGGFEDPDIATRTWKYFTSIPGWTPINGCGIEIQNHAAGSPHEGDQFVELNSQCKSGLTQTVEAEAQGLFILSFWFSPRPGTQAEDNKLKVLWNGEPVATVGPEPGGSGTAWSHRYVAVTGTGSCGWAPNTVTFKSAGSNPSGGGVGVYLDDVRVTPAFQAADDSECPVYYDAPSGGMG